MKLHSTLLAVSASLALAATGCLVGEVDPGDGSIPSDGTGTPSTGTPGSGTPGAGDTGGVVPPAETPEAAFQAVIPAIATSCGANGNGCHAVNNAPVFVTAGDPATVDLTAAYQLVKANKDSLYRNNAPTDPILTYGDGVGHTGGTFQYSSEHLQAVQSWLSAEAAQPVNDEPSPLAIWSGCMDLGQFQASGMADAWADKNAQGQGDCDACHNLGADNFIASNVDTRVFEALTTSPRLMASYFTINADGTEVIINEARLTKVGTRQDPHQLHGAFNLNDDAYDRLVQFYNQTKARVDDPNIQCQPPRFQ